MNKDIFPIMVQIILTIGFLIRSGELYGKIKPTFSWLELAWIKLFYAILLVAAISFIDHLP